ncbi:MAG: Txe/YoeB family addiction module toxin [Verrucomicrobiota bacterium]
MNWLVTYTKQAQKDAQRIAATKLRPQTQRLLDILAIDPFQTPPPYEKLIGDLTGAYSRRINLQHRLVYQVDATQHRVKVLRMWSHYE